MDSELFSLAGKVALITGASSGLGRHFATVVADAGARVAVTARRCDRLVQLVGELESNDRHALAVTMDVTAVDSVISAFDVVERELGPVNILINNAGVARPGYFVDVTEEDWDFVMETNLKGAWRVAGEASRRMINAGTGGAIVNIASLLAQATQSQQSVYAISKAGIAHMTRSMAGELLRYNIRVNAIAPGYFKTEINEEFFDSEKGRAYLNTIPARRLGEPEELNGALLLFASAAGSFITGVVLPVDGGHLVAGR